VTPSREIVVCTQSRFDRVPQFGLEPNQLVEHSSDITHHASVILLGRFFHGIIFYGMFWCDHRQPEIGTPRLSNPEDEIRGRLASYETGLNTSDASAAAACYADDGIFMPTTLPTASGADMKAACEQIFAAISLNVTFTIDELIVVSHDVAYALTRSNGTQTVLANGTESAESNREIFIFRHDGDDWKIARYMFNKPE
jgi:ketosteroid isomerase-like protein